MSVEEDLFLPYSCTNSLTEEIGRTMTARITSVMSIFGSFYIICTVASKRRKDASLVDPYQRIMLGFSASDIMSSFFYWFMGQWMTPAETGWWGAVGNTQTCTAQGFLFLFGWVGAVCYQMALSLNILLLIRYGWTQSKFERKIERWMHWAILAAAVLYTSVPLFYQGYNPYCGVCDLVPMPFWCGDWIFGDGSECERGSPAVANVIWIIWFVGIGGMVLLCTVAMFMVYFGVRSTERKSSIYRSHTASHDRESKRIRGTMLMYTIGLYVFWVVPVFILLIPQAFAIYWLSAWYYVLYPLQGFYNFLVFLHPKCKRYQRLHPGTWLATAYLRIVFPMGVIRRIRQRFVTSAPSATTMDGDDGIGFNSFNEEDGNRDGTSEIAPSAMANDQSAVNAPMESTKRSSVKFAHELGEDVPSHVINDGEESSVPCGD